MFNNSVVNILTKLSCDGFYFLSGVTVNNLTFFFNTNFLSCYFLLCFKLSFIYIRLKSSFGHFSLFCLLNKTTLCFGFLFNSQGFSFAL